MDALISDIKRFAVHDGDGIRTTLFLKGCTLRCVWCHNPEGISARPELAYYAERCLQCGVCAEVCPNGVHEFSDKGHALNRDLCLGCGKCEEECLGNALKLYGRKMDVDMLFPVLLEDEDFFRNSGGGVTVSGGEPLLHAEFVRELFEKLKKHSVNTAVDTCGHVPWDAFERVLPVTDLFLYDIKHIDSAMHKQLTGMGNERILENLQRLSECNKRIEIRMPFVPGCNSDDDTLHGIGAFLGKLNIERMRVLPYHDLARGKYAALNLIDTMPQVEAPTDELLAHAVEILHSHGVQAFSGRE
ncbi:glycyl-radical enzyme activating protein [Paenibacillus sp.]